MSVIKPAHGSLLQFFRSGPLPCPYLPGRVERKLFTRLSGRDTAETNSQLSRAGFRRSHDILYRPVCEGCTACLPVRIPAHEFAPSRTMKRTIKRNVDLTPGVENAIATAEHYQLFHRYELLRHADSDMARMSFSDYADMIEEGASSAFLLTLRDAEGDLWGAMLVDRLKDGFSAVYSYFRASSGADRSLGTQLVLTLTNMAAAQASFSGEPRYIYLGYYINGSRKMDYKARFQPLEILGPEGWIKMQDQ